jgi:hypothetical protein
MSESQLGQQQQAQQLGQHQQALQLELIKNSNSWVNSNESYSINENCSYIGPVKTRAPAHQQQQELQLQQQQQQVQQAYSKNSWIRSPEATTGPTATRAIFGQK